MEINNGKAHERDILPEGKISLRRVASRNKLQVYIGGKYIPACSGDTVEEIIESMRWFYHMDARANETINSLRNIG